MSTHPTMRTSLWAQTVLEQCQTWDDSRDWTPVYVLAAEALRHRYRTDTEPHMLYLGCRMFARVYDEQATWYTMLYGALRHAADTMPDSDRRREIACQATAIAADADACARIADDLRMLTRYYDRDEEEMEEPQP